MVYCNSGINLCSVAPGHTAILNHRGSVSLTVHVFCDLGFLKAVLRTKKINKPFFLLQKILYFSFCMPVKHQEALRQTVYFIHRWKKSRGYIHTFLKLHKPQSQTHTEQRANLALLSKNTGNMHTHIHPDSPNETKGKKEILLCYANTPFQNWEN